MFRSTASIALFAVAVMSTVANAGNCSKNPGPPQWIQPIHRPIQPPVVLPVQPPVQPPVHQPMPIGRRRADDTARSVGSNRRATFAGLPGSRPGG